ncbi:MAG TPA: serine/threonine transporter SstT [Ruminococcaceae bacterium]|jgi:serine/threonine transporter|nr:serine/threonine transporter SstT [Oscillospiraceae bacterium]
MVSILRLFLCVYFYKDKVKNVKKLVQKWNSINLIVRIAGGIVIGVLLALIFPKIGWLSILGTVFVGALKAIAPILVFVLVCSSIAQATGKFGRKFATVILLYMISTLTAAVIATFVSFLFPVTLTFTQTKVAQTAPSGIGEVFSNLLQNIIANPISSLANANYIGILVWAILIGLALRAASSGTKQILVDLSDAISKIVRWIISFAPFGIMGLIYHSISTSGLQIFVTYGKLIAILVGCILFVAFVSNPAIATICLKRNPYPLVLRCLKESGLPAFFTRSSAANIPINMDLCEKLGLDKDMYSVSIPLGATINMNGAAVTITVMTLAAVHTLGIPVNIPTALFLSALSTLAACGASGIAGGSLLMIPLACASFGISNDIAMQVVGVGFIIGVIQDACETALNSSGDVFFAAVAEYREWIKEGKEVKL